MTALKYHLSHVSPFGWQFAFAIGCVLLSYFVGLWALVVTI
jgi:hypothetical protein